MLIGRNNIIERSNTAEDIFFPTGLGCFRELKTILGLFLKKMALRTVKGTRNVPEGCTPVSKNEALDYQKKFVQDWPKESDVIFLKYGKHIASTIAGISSVVCWSHFRPILRLKNYGKVKSFITCSVIPIISVDIFYDKFVTDHVLLMKIDCPLCTSLKYSLFQLFNGFVSPTAIGFAFNTLLATQYKTYAVPDFKASLKSFKMYSKLFNFGAPKFQIVAAVQLITALFLPYMQSNELLKITDSFEKLNYNENLENIEYM